MKIKIIYGSNTGNTRAAAETIQRALNGDLLDVAKFNLEHMRDADLLVLGTSTWGVGELQDDWARCISTLESANLSGQKVALFGCGDQAGWGDSFVDGMGILYEIVVQRGAIVVGKVAPTGYDFLSSRALVDGQFVGLPLDESNQSSLTESRIASWTEALKTELKGTEGKA